MSSTRTPSTIGRVLERVLILGLLLGGAVITLWPVAESTRSVMMMHRGTKAHEAAIEAVAPEVLDADWADAQAYNLALPTGALNDPWTAQGTDQNETYAAYLAQLNPLGDSVMGGVAIPRIGVNLPIRHDTTWDAMSDGAGHMFGTTLPVGGEGNHAVIAAHTGWPGHTFFDRLPELELGDWFTISVLGRDLVYRVDQITVVDPDDLEQIQRIPGADLVTLVTCQQGPSGGFTKRLLVRGHRVDGDQATQASGQTPQGLSGVIPGHAPWMNLRLAVAAGALLASLLVVARWWRLAHRPPVHHGLTSSDTTADSVTEDGMEDRS